MRRVQPVEVIYNLFAQYSPTGYRLVAGEPICGRQVYLMKPIYPHTGMAEFTMTSGGRNVSSFYRTRHDGWLTGDIKKKQGLILRPQPGRLELWRISLQPVVMRSRFDGRELTQLLVAAKETVAPGRR